jgi:DNA-binding transcriptional ArsR family regulator
MIEDQLSRTFAALADPTRRAILTRLTVGEATVGELAEPFAVSLQAISKHLQVLERAGLISRGKNAQWRPCRLQAAPLVPAVEWIQANRQVWEDRIDRLDAHLQTLQQVAPDNRRPKDHD